MNLLKRYIKITLIFLLLIQSKSYSQSICGLTGDDIICQDFIQSALDNYPWESNCDAPACSYIIGIGSYQGQDIILIKEDCFAGAEQSSYWEIYNCSGNLLEQCDFSIFGNCDSDGVVLAASTIDEYIFECLEFELPVCESGCNYFECVDVEVSVSASNGGVVNVSDFIIESGGICSPSFSINTYTDELFFNCDDVGVHNITIYDYNNPNVFCDYSIVTVIDGGCDDAECTFLECIDVEEHVGFDYGAVIDVTDVVVEYGGECDYSFSVSENLDQLVFDCDDIGTHTITVYDYFNPEINCVVQITIVDDGCNTGECDHPDYAALMAIYHSTNGDNWENNDGWREGTTGTNCNVCQWKGITCDENSRVIKIDFFLGNDLTGTLPQVLNSGLEFLESLRMTNDHIGGPIPSWIYRLSNLNDFWLGYNDLEGSLSSDIGDLTNLTVLSLTGNNLSGTIPKEIGQLTNLKNLYLYKNQFSGFIPSEIGNCTSLAYIDISENMLAGSIHNTIWRLDNLHDLVLNNNNLTGTISSQIQQAQNLVNLDLSYNNFSGSIPSNIGNVSYLTRVYLQNNYFTGEIPTSIGQLSKLKRLILRNNSFSGAIPQELNDLSSMENLYLDNNNFSGCFPDDFQTICNLGFQPGGASYQDGYDFTNNPLLPYQGDLEKVCNGNPQIGAPCDDGINGNGYDVINEDCGCGQYTAVKDVDVLDVFIYPNPVHDYLIISGIDEVESYQITNIIGNKISGEYYNNQQIDITSLTMGLYFINFYDKNQKLVYSSKFVKR